MKFIALVFSCLFIFAMPAHANDADTFNAMVALANKGDAEAQYHVGMMHNNGIGTQKDPKLAFEWFQKSTASNDRVGVTKLGARCWVAVNFGTHNPPHPTIRWELTSLAAIMPGNS